VRIFFAIHTKRQLIIANNYLINRYLRLLTAIHVLFVDSDKLSTPYAGLKLLKTHESAEFIDIQYVQDVDKLL